MRRLARVAAGVALAILGFILFVVWRFDSQMRGTAIDASEVFETLIARPAPATVTDLQAVASTGMQGYDAYVRFRTPSLAAVGLDGPGHEPIGCDEILIHLKLPERIRSPFSPEWELPASADRRCLRAMDVRNAWAASAMNHLLYADGWVYFASSGD